MHFTVPGSEEGASEGIAHWVCWYCRCCKDMVEVEGKDPLPDVVPCPKCGTEHRRFK